jgi:hypothetical protein
MRIRIRESKEFKVRKKNINLVYWYWI